jgi:hypothetical protein
VQPSVDHTLNSLPKSRWGGFSTNVFRWTIRGAVDAAGKELPSIKGRGLELVKKKYGHSSFVATRKMVIWKGC